MHITWKRTVIGGDELPYDFCAYVENITIARIYRSKDSSGVSIWSVNMQIGDATSDTCWTRLDAIQMVEQRLAHFLTTERGKTDPQEWPHDQRSAQLWLLRHSNPKQHAVLVEDLRSGRVDRCSGHLLMTNWFCLTLTRQKSPCSFEPTSNSGLALHHPSGEAIPRKHRQGIGT
ncbi:hypothetical protein HQ945_08795 [Phyllobacterium sp. BT25]|uniref:Uncharacterized protein n=1 Tax=Phyllobacterium pellucidum TaxID=2740464 RepID=A0A849VTJ3_9HYPH|nr:hypothetical protein [Phyllobacterium pellucidum]NTS31350.1 hypothetical protein [Phyllobacterium pellucidum]